MYHCLVRVFLSSILYLIIELKNQVVSYLSIYYELERTCFWNVPVQTIVYQKALAGCKTQC